MVTNVKILVEIIGVLQRDGKGREIMNSTTMLYKDGALIQLP